MLNVGLILDMQMCFSANVGLILDMQMCFSAKRGTHTGYADVL